ASTKQWQEEPARRRAAQDRIRQLQSFIKKNWRLRLLFERGRVDPLCQAVHKEAKNWLKAPLKNIKTSPSSDSKKTKKKIP
ncbi:MAG: hypothetical protein Q6361_06115, partial [Candidatus Hermodarchaeota archaeon]|nr:hypothetical protein [Candidatus Hermodarchaeota archaeon]